MPEEKACPFKFVAPYSTVKLCTKSKCELWSTTLTMCSITLGMNSLTSIAYAIRDISDNIKSLDNFQT